MEIIKTPIEGLLVINPKIFGDDRGYFFESWSEESFANKFYKSFKNNYYE